MCLTDKIFWLTEGGCEKKRQIQNYILIFGLKNQPKEWQCPGLLISEDAAQWNFPQMAATTFARFPRTLPLLQVEPGPVAALAGRAWNGIMEMI